MPRARSTTTETADERSAPEESGSLALLGGVLARIRAHESSFTAVERRIAAALHADGRELVGLPLDQLAGRMEVSEASIIRFCRRLGYSGLRELKLALAAEVRGDLRATTLPIAVGDGYAEIVSKVTLLAQQALSDSREVLDPRALQRATETLLCAGRIQLFGVGGSAPIAQDAHYRFARLGLPVAVLTDAHLQSIVAANLGSADVAFVVSHTGRSREPVHVLEEAKASGATTILLTSYANTPAARWADVVLLTAPVATTAWEGMAPLRVAQLSVIDMLCVAIVGHGDARRSDFRARYDALLARHMLPGGSGFDRPVATSLTAGDIRTSSDDEPRPISAVATLEATAGETAHDRRLTIDGVENVRHLGGFRLADGTETAPIVLRSGMLHELTPAGIAQLRSLGVAAVVDLRNDPERLTYPTPDLADAGIRVALAPMYEIPNLIQPDLDDQAGWIAVYRAWAECSQPAMRTLVETIAHTDGAVLMHCHLGADRTGIAAALLLDLAGAGEDDILADYGASPDGRGFEFLLAAMLARVRDRWGSTAAYFADAGVGEDLLAQAVARMTGRRLEGSADDRQPLAHSEGCTSSTP